jgi:E3 ubiquitin-protein ligase DOA10
MDGLGQLGVSNGEQDEEKEELVNCKICFAEGSNDSPLLHGVCDCKGSLDRVHGR